MVQTGLKLLAFGGALWVLLSLFERSSVYPLDPTRVSPAAAGLPSVQEITFDTGEATLVLWVARPQEGKPVVLYFHGNAGNLSNRAERFSILTEAGYGLIAMAYRGSGGSSGRPSERAITADVTALYDRLQDVIPGLSPNHVVLYGESLGTGVVARLVSLRPDAQPRAVILEAPFTSIPDLARHHMPWTAALTWKLTNRWASRTHIGALRSPLLILHGDRDRVVPIEQGRTIYESASSPDKRFYHVDGAGHDDIWRDTTLRELQNFMDRGGQD